MSKRAFVVILGIGALMLLLLPLEIKVANFSAIAVKGFFTAPDYSRRLFIFTVGLLQIFSLVATANRLYRASSMRLASGYYDKYKSSEDPIFAGFFNIVFSALSLLCMLGLVAGIYHVAHEWSILGILSCISLFMLSGLLLLAPAGLIMACTDWIPKWMERLDALTVDDPERASGAVRLVAGAAAALLLLLSAFGL